jgi:DNA polymerase III delta subunit
MARTATLTETEFQSQVLALARISGWKACHPHDEPGSLILCRPPVLLFVGLKTETGKLRHEQREWLEALRARESAEVILCQPGDWEAIAERLARRDENLARSPPGTPFTELRPEEKRERYKEQQRRRREGGACRT